MSLFSPYAFLTPYIPFRCKVEMIEKVLAEMCRYSHEYSRKGLLFHIPLPHPSFTLHLTISRLLLPGDASEKDGKPTLEPFLVELHPAKPISGIATRGELGVSEMIQLIKGMAGRIDGLEWGTGR